MAETTGLLNRRTGHSVPRVRISSSPQKSLTERSVRDFWLIVARKMSHFCRKCIKNVARRRVTFGEELEEADKLLGAKKQPFDICIPFVLEFKWGEHFVGKPLYLFLIHLNYF